MARTASRRVPAATVVGGSKHTERYSRSPNNPTLQLFRKSSKSASAGSWRPIGNSFGRARAWDFWENGCRTHFLPGDPTHRLLGLLPWPLHATVDHPTVPSRAPSLPSPHAVAAQPARRGRSARAPWPLSPRAIAAQRASLPNIQAPCLRTDVTTVKKDCAILSLRQKVESPGLTKRHFSVFDWLRQRLA